jgi:hypothetical protein
MGLGKKGKSEILNCQSFYFLPQLKVLWPNADFPLVLAKANFGFLYNTVGFSQRY